MSEERRARLAALAAKAGRNKPPAESATSHNPEEATPSQALDPKPQISFRNYVPKDATLNASATSGAGDGESSDQLAEKDRVKRRKANESSSTARHAPIIGDGSKRTPLEQALAKTNRESREAAGQDVGNASSWVKVTPIAPRKVNWDLKRDIQHKMEKLEKRTQKAIVELLRERLEREAREASGDDSSDLD